MILPKKKKEFTVEEMIKMENELRDSELYSCQLSPNDPKLFEKLKLKVEYVDDMSDDNEAELMPSMDERYLGLIRLRKELKKYKFAYIHEVIHFIFDVGYGNKVEETFTRKRQGKTNSEEEQRINYKTAAYIMEYNQICSRLREYDNSRPKADELKFISSLQKDYEQGEETVLRRIREVRRLEKAGYATVSSFA